MNRINGVTIADLTTELACVLERLLLRKRELYDMNELFEY